MFSRLSSFSLLTERIHSLSRFNLFQLNFDCVMLPSHTVFLREKYIVKLQAITLSIKKINSCTGVCYLNLPVMEQVSKESKFRGHDFTTQESYTRIFIHPHLSSPHHRLNTSLFLWRHGPPPPLISHPFAPLKKPPLILKRQNLAHYLIMNTQATEDIIDYWLIIYEDNLPLNM